MTEAATRFTQPTMKSSFLTSLYVLWAFPAVSAWAQVPSRMSGMTYRAEVAGTTSSGRFAPQWLTAGRYGLSSSEPHSGYVRGAVERRIENDSLRLWRLGYGIDLAVAAGMTSVCIPQQYYAEVEYRGFRLTAGCREMDMELKNDALSSGGMTFSDNARPVPQLRLAIPEWKNISRHARMVWLKAHAAYGMMTDGHWTEDFAGGRGQTANLFMRRVLYHSKAAYFRFGNPERFPLNFTLGLEMVAQFGGKVWNVRQRGGNSQTLAQCEKLPTGLKAFWQALIPGGSDVNDGDFANVQGNQLGSWNLSLDWTADNWSARTYLDHYFEDHSQMFIQYGWRDMLLGFEVQPPKNPVVDGMVYEFIRTTDQSGPVYHDATSEFPIQISGADMYYNHHIYGCYQHWGMVMGNPLIVSPVYNGDAASGNVNGGKLFTYHSRVVAHHLGLSGAPVTGLQWRALLSHQKSLGNYTAPLTPMHQTSWMLEAAYTPARQKAWCFKVAVAGHHGDILGNSTGASFAVCRNGLIFR